MVGVSLRENVHIAFTADHVNAPARRVVKKVIGRAKSRELFLIAPDSSYNKSPVGRMVLFFDLFLE
jgi:hypothetical protein